MDIPVDDSCGMKILATNISLTHLDSQPSLQDFPDLHHQLATQSKKKKQNNCSGNLAHPHFRPKSGKPRHQKNHRRGATTATVTDRFFSPGNPGQQDASKVWRICIRSWITVHVGSNDLMPRSGWVGGWEIVGGW